MIIKEKIGNLNTIQNNDKTIDPVEIEWFECNKRIFHKISRSGEEIVFRFLQENPNLTEGDIIYEDDSRRICISIRSCDVIIVSPADMKEMASACYELGNRHLPLFIDENDLLIPYDEPLFNLLKRSGYKIEKGKKKLEHPLRTSVLPHGEFKKGKSVFSMIMKLSGQNE